jgi:hypothetical protein
MVPGWWGEFLCSTAEARGQGEHRVSLIDVHGVGPEFISRLDDVGVQEREHAYSLRIAFTPAESTIASMTAIVSMPNMFPAMRPFGLCV